MENRAIEELKSLATHWNRVEGRVKQIELLREEVVVPAINELRYAGRRIVDAIAKLASESEQVRAEGFTDIEVARQYIVNADHDLTDAAVAFITERADEVVRKAGYKTLQVHVPEHAKLFETIKNANNLVVESREDRTRRSEIYGRLATEHLPFLLQQYAHLKDHELHGAIRDEKIKWVQVRLFVVGAVLLVGAIGVMYMTTASYHQDAKNETSTSKEADLPHPRR